MTNKVPCGGFTIGDNMQVVDGELSSRVVGGYTNHDIWEGHLYNNTSINDDKLYNMIVNNVGEMATLTFICETGGKMDTLTNEFKIEDNSFGIGFLFMGGAFYADKTNIGVVTLSESSAIEITRVGTTTIHKIPSEYLEIGSGGDYLPLTGGTLENNSYDSAVLTLKNSNGINTLQIKENISQGELNTTLDIESLKIKMGTNLDHKIGFVYGNDSKVHCGIECYKDSYGEIDSYLVLTNGSQRYKIYIDGDGALKTKTLN